MAFTFRFSQALAYAHDLHRNQPRKHNGEPYIAHLLSVAALVIEQGADEDTAIAALLHDAFEDQWWETADETLAGRVEAVFGSRVAAIVNELTEVRVPAGMTKPPWRERKQAYLAHLATASKEALLIAAADKLHNARCTLADYRNGGDEVWDKFNMGRNSQEWWYYAVLGVLRDHLGLFHPLVDELEAVVGELFAVSTPRKTP